MQGLRYRAFRNIALFWLVWLMGCANQLQAQSTSQQQKVTDAMNATRPERAAGAVIGLLVGEALGMGTQWYYDMDVLHRDHGIWVNDYVDPKPDGDHAFARVSKLRYDQGLRAGDVAQSGQIYMLLLDSIISEGRFNSADFFRRLDGLFTTLNGESYSGRYTESLYRLLLGKRRDGIAWDNPAMATSQDSADGAELIVLLAALYPEPETFVREADRFLKVFFTDAFTRGNQITYGLVVQGLINGAGVQDINAYMKGLSKNKQIYTRVGGYDRFLTPGYGAIAQQQDLVTIKEPRYISHVYGMDCQFMHLVPAAYYLLYRFPDNFEMATLSASNGGGNNMARAALTGALAGAVNGLNGIPERFIKGLADGENLIRKARQVSTLIN
ncbi:ADP-ribosylglycohydrolase family protein [Sansalvadorimonas verongulae]|uniref:ADP-ribosylglycohydrolase family protein n=1 Tax=Sansalvadorimonas verongulae TaxID=2172824 RepID=UPI0018AD11EE|nr:ADP-ribosylglycohydrolase family protein [Sansalvadorimonas verongulae]